MTQRARCGSLLIVGTLLLTPSARSVDNPSVSGAVGTTVQGRNWKEIAELPDFTTGIWEIGFGRPRAGYVMPEGPSLTPAYAAKRQAYQERQKSGGVHDNPNANCVPTGMPGIMSPPFPLQILYTPGQVVINFEAYMQRRIIFTDGRAHPKDPDLTYNGHSIGHWEGDTLVVDTVGISTDTPMSSSSLLQDFGAQHSEKLHIVERVRLIDADTLLVDTIVEDPDALSKPWRYPREFRRHRDWTLAEYICNQNNRDSVDQNGNATLDLTPPPSELKAKP
jgi:hypothetical protein